MRWLVIIIFSLCFVGCEKDKQEPESSNAPSPAAGEAKPVPSDEPDEPDQARAGAEDSAAGMGQQVVIVDSDSSVDDTVARIKKDIEAAGLTIMAEVDHSGNAAKANLELPPTKLIIFGKPAVGTKLMQAKRTVAIDLPQKMLIWDEDGKTKVAYNDPKVLLARHGAEVPPAMIDKISGLLGKLATGEE